MDKKLVNKIKRQRTLTSDEKDDFEAYDDIVAKKWDGIPNLKEEDYYVEFIDPVGRDLVQQAVNIYSTQKPKWDVLPRGLGDINTAEQFERIIEWYMMKASQYGRKRFHSEALISACKYNKVCLQIEWIDDYAYRRLMNAQRGDDVTGIATTLGFAHLGRFASVYRQAFGESPSQTLRHSAR